MTKLKALNNFKFILITGDKIKLIFFEDAFVPFTL